MIGQPLILIVADDPTWCGDAERLLAGAGFVVSLAGDRATARRLLDRQPPDLILLDAVLPDADGVECCRDLKRDPRFADTFVVLMFPPETAPSHEEEADGYLVHPISDPQLLAWVRAILRLRAAQSTRDAMTRTLSETEGRLLTDLTFSNQAMIEDSTGLKLAEEAVRERDARLRVLFNGARDIILVFPLDEKAAPGKFIEANDIACEALEYSREELLAMGPLDLTVTQDPSAIAQVLRRLLRDGVAFFEASGRTRDGRTIPFEVSAHVIQMAGQRLVMTVSRDITERRGAQEALRESEERYRTLFECAGDAILIHDLTGRFLEVNAVACERLGYSREELLGMNAAEIYSPGCGAPTATGVCETAHLCRDGAEIPVELLSTQFEYRGQQAILSIARDISKRKTLEAELLQSRKMEAIGRLAGGVAHDFNNILTAILGYTDFLLARLSKKDPRRGDLQAIRHAGDRARVLTQQLLAFSRRQVLQPQSVCLNDVIAGMLGMLERLIGEDVELIAVMAEPLGQARVDPGQLQQVIMNLVVNAREAMPRGGTLTIHTEEIDIDERLDCPCGEIRPGRHVMMSVSDTGTGIDEATRARLFEPFFTTKETGTGLGLATVYGIIEQSGGHITVDSAPGNGATFRVYFPLAERDGGQPAQEPVSEASPAPAATETILVVEDAESVRMLTERVLREAGFTVLAAGDGAEALRLCREYPGAIHLLLTDVVMPGGMSGPQVAEALRGLQPDARVLYMSGYTDDAVLRYGVLEGELAFLEKPFSAENLLRKIREILQSPARPVRP